MIGKLTTHALDTARGAPAAGLRLTLYRLSPQQGEHEPRHFTLGDDGRATLLEAPDLESGLYEIVFLVADYQKEKGFDLPDPPFFGEIPVRFGIADSKAHYHVPLILSPYGYSTYRGG